MENCGSSVSLSPLQRDGGRHVDPSAVGDGGERVEPELVEEAEDAGVGGPVEPGQVQDGDHVHGNGADDEGLQVRESVVLHKFGMFAIGESRTRSKTESARRRWWNG